MQHSLHPLRVLCLKLVLLIAPSVGFAAPGDEHWDPQFGWPGTTNIVQAIAVHNGRVYAGGWSGYPTVSNTTLHVWNGSQWSGLGDFAGSGGVNVRDLAFVGDTLYAAGNFTHVDGVPARGLARWNGSG